MAAGWAGKIRAAEDDVRDYLQPLVDARMYRDELPGELDEVNNGQYVMDVTGGGEPADISCGNYDQPGLTAGASPDERFIGVELRGIFISKDQARTFVEQLWDALPMSEDQTKSSWQFYLTDEPRIERGQYGRADREGETATVWAVTAPLTMQIHKDAS